MQRLVSSSSLYKVLSRARPSARYARMQSNKPPPAPAGTGAQAASSAAAGADATAAAAGGQVARESAQSRGPITFASLGIAAVTLGTCQRRARGSVCGIV